MCPLDKGVANLGLLCYPIPVFMGVIRSVVNHTFVSCDQAEKDKSIHVNMGWAARVCFIGLPFDPNWQEDWQLKMLDIPNSPFTLGFHKGCFVCTGGGPAAYQHRQPKGQFVCKHEYRFRGELHPLGKW